MAAAAKRAREAMGDTTIKRLSGAQLYALAILAANHPRPVVLSNSNPPPVNGVPRFTYIGSPTAESLQRRGLVTISSLRRTATLTGSGQFVAVRAGQGDAALTEDAP